MQVITIGQLAGNAGVTVKGVRHYHRVGLLAEPPRDSSGYRRYTAEQAIELVKIRTLADAGVPLARIKELLAADPDQFTAAIAEIDRNLQRRAEELARTRERIGQLGGGDALFVTVEVADYLDQLHQLGISDRTVRMERDIWILLLSVSPRRAASWIADKLDSISDPEFRAIYLEYDAAIDWSPDDPGLHALADRAQQWLANQPQKSGSPGSGDSWSPTRPSPGSSRPRPAGPPWPGTGSPRSPDSATLAGDRGADSTVEEPTCRLRALRPTGQMQREPKSRSWSPSTSLWCISRSRR